MCIQGRGLSISLILFLFFWKRELDYFKSCAKRFLSCSEVFVKAVKFFWQQQCPVERQGSTGSVRNFSKCTGQLQ